MAFGQRQGRGRIPLHRSVRYVRFASSRLLIWTGVAVAATAVQLYFQRGLIRTYGATVEWLLALGRVPFERGPSEHLAFLAIPAWSVESFNPVALLPGALTYLSVGLLLALVVWRIPKLPFPLAAWLSLLGVMLLITTLVLGLSPMPRFTPIVFSGMWVKVMVATALVFPWFWVLMVGVLPLPTTRVAFWGGVAWASFGLWNALRLAFFLALARAAGLVWLPLAFMLGCTLPDCFVFVIAFSRVLEPAGREWEEPA